MTAAHSAGGRRPRRTSRHGRRLGPVARVARGGTRHRLQALIIGVVAGVSTAASVLAVGLLADSNAPFDHAFAAQHGAHLAVTIDPALVTPAQLTATGHVPGVTAVSGPYPAVTIAPEVTATGGAALRLPQVTLVGRGSPGGRLDRLTLEAGRWVRRPGELVVSSDLADGTGRLGQRLTVAGRRGARLTVVGIARSVTDTADGWVEPGQVAALRAAGTQPAAQLLYRLRGARTAADVGADVAALTRALPAGALTGTQSYLAARARATSSIAPIVPFLIAFSCLGLVMAVLIVVNVISGAVVTGRRRIGILKSIGCTPAQVAAAYVLQAAVPAAAGVAAGLAAGDLLAVPVLDRTASAYGVGALTVPAWADLAVAAGMCAVVAAATLLPSLRAARLSAVQVIATGRTPGQGHGYAAHRVLGRLRLPRPLTLGLAAPFAQPARTAMTAAAVLSGATAVIFAAGLSSSLNLVAANISQSRTEPIQVGYSPGSAALDDRSQQKVDAALRRQPGTLRFTAEAVQNVSVAGIPQQVPAHAFRGDASWTGYSLISGRWFSGAGEIDVPQDFLTVTGKAVGGTVTISANGRRLPVRIVGEVFDLSNHGLTMLADWPTLARIDPGLPAAQYDVQLKPGAGLDGYAAALGRVLGPGYWVSTQNPSPLIPAITGLVGLLSVAIALIAGLGVLNTVVLFTRERAGDLGVLKALGMTPGQTIATVVSAAALTGLLAGLAAVPAGVALHRYILPLMAGVAGNGVPATFLNVYRAPELTVLALAGLFIAALGALLPAARAARSRTAAALHTE